ncbi:hypothetical protein HYFRA_00012593 [Hymenoscyphus fraxineus]|uniref:Sec39 domain-containing protein n=1 Tax=Hymenoscyphus fraxineus TaxID=746836 RepID=A0A9N9L7Q6_9HELO|nr:hypothetical protein HYFRA_00012593 [Hymenoscyphus fraxineus]
MAGSDVSPAKAVLLAVQLAAAVDLKSFESLVSRFPKPLHKELVLRIILTYLPEIVEASEYVPFLQRLEVGELENDSDFEPTKFGLDELDEVQAKKKVRKLRLLALEPPYDLADEDPSPLIRFIVLRALRVDEHTGIITQLPELLQPFLHLSTYLRTWMISTILPLLRFNYEYHAEGGIPLTIPKFERLDDEAGVKLLLSKTASNEESTESNVGRDLRGLVGPWMYGDTRWKRRKSRLESQPGLQHSTHFDQNPVSNEKCIGWEEVFKWITQQAGNSWRTAVDAIEQWDGPGDVDVGEYGNGSIWLDEDEQQLLERRYARAALASAYLVPEESEDALNGVYRILERLIILMDQDRVPSLPAACSLLMPIFMDEEFPTAKHSLHLRNNLLSEENSLTKPGEVSVQILHALVISAYLCTRIGSGFTVRRAGELALLQDETEQKIEFGKLLINVRNGPKGDDKYWIKLRNEILWLRSWGVEETLEGADASKGKGILGQLSKEFIEAELLTLLLTNTRYTLARSIYEKSPERPLSKKALEDTVIAAAMNAYDNATNPNKTRGGVKKCHDILQAFPDTLSDSLQRHQLESLVNVTHSLENYRLVFKQGENFKPVTLRVHGDPISIIGKVLDQNERSYLKIVDFLAIGRGMVKAGLTMRNVDGSSKEIEEKDLNEQLLIADKRVVSMCIAAALAEDDFETAYSYVVTRLKKIGGPAQSRSPHVDHNVSGLTAEIPPKSIDDWSWMAALEAGKYRRNPNTISPANQVNGSASDNVRHLEQRIECLAQALRLAPKSTLQDILNAYRRCEEELEAAVKLEAEQEALWDTQGDDQFMPGGFQSNAPTKQITTSTNARTNEEAPMSLFDLSRASMARAQTGFSALSRLRGSTESERPQSRELSDSPGQPKVGTRKRDQVKNLAVGGLASGIGWLINAPAPQMEDHDEQ